MPAVTTPLHHLCRVYRLHSTIHAWQRVAAAQRAQRLEVQQQAALQRQLEAAAVETAARQWQAAGRFRRLWLQHSCFTSWRQHARRQRELRRLQGQQQQRRAHVSSFLQRLAAQASQQASQPLQQGPSSSSQQAQHVSSSASHQHDRGAGATVSAEALHESAARADRLMGKLASYKQQQAQRLQQRQQQAPSAGKPGSDTVLTTAAAQQQACTPKPQLHKSTSPVQLAPGTIQEQQEQQQEHSGMDAAAARSPLVAAAGEGELEALPQLQPPAMCRSPEPAAARQAHTSVSTPAAAPPGVRPTAQHTAAQGPRPAPRPVSARAAAARASAPTNRGAWQPPPKQEQRPAAGKIQRSCSQLPQPSTAAPEQSVAVLSAAEKQRLAEQQKALAQQQIALARLHYARSLLLRAGLRPWRAVLASRGEELQAAGQHYSRRLLGTCLLAWKLHLYACRHERCMLQLQGYGMLQRVGHQALLRACLTRLGLWAVGSMWGRARLARKALRVLMGAQQMTSRQRRAAEQMWAQRLLSR